VLPRAKIAPGLDRMRMEGPATFHRGRGAISAMGSSRAGLQWFSQNALSVGLRAGPTPSNRAVSSAICVSFGLLALECPGGSSRLFQEGAARGAGSRSVILQSAIWRRRRR